jgi:hypothetical protein
VAVLGLQHHNYAAGVTYVLYMSLLEIQLLSSPQTCSSTGKIQQNGLLFLELGVNKHQQHAF